MCIFCCTGPRKSHEKKPIVYHYPNLGKPEDDTSANAKQDDTKVTSPVQKKSDANTACPAKKLEAEQSTSSASSPTDASKVEDTQGLDQGKEDPLSPEVDHEEDSPQLEKTKNADKGNYTHKNHAKTQNIRKEKKHVSLLC